LSADAGKHALTLLFDSMDECWRRVTELGPLILAQLRRIWPQRADQRCASACVVVQLNGRKNSSATYGRLLAKPSRTVRSDLATRSAHGGQCSSSRRYPKSRAGSVPCAVTGIDVQALAATLSLCECCSTSPKPAKLSAAPALISMRQAVNDCAKIPIRQHGLSPADDHRQ